MKVKNIVNDLTIGIGGLPISDATDSFLKGPAKKVRVVYIFVPLSTKTKTINVYVCE